MNDEFKDHPTTINEHKANKTSKASDWRLRDCLISVLRDIDSGKYKGDVYGAVVIFEDKGDGETLTSFSVSARNHAEALGIFEAGKQLYVKDARDG